MGRVSVSLQHVIAAQVNQYVWDFSGQVDNPSASESSTPQISIWEAEITSQMLCGVHLLNPRRLQIAANPNPSTQKILGAFWEEWQLGPNALQKQGL